jgi:hypothetical protein
MCSTQRDKLHEVISTVAKSDTNGQIPGDANLRQRG